MALLSAIALGQSDAPTEDKKVTLELPATRIDLILQQVSKMSGRILLADPALKSEVLLISVKDMPLQDFMKKVATVTDGSWNEIANEFSLVPNQAVRTSEESQVQKRRTGALDKALATLPTEDPVSILLNQQPHDTLAALMPGQRIVFSSNPNSEQVAADGADADFVSFALNRYGGMPRMLRSAPNDRGQSSQEQAALEPSKVDLAVSNTGRVLSVQLIIYNGRGNEMTMGMQNIEFKVGQPEASPLPASLTTPDTGKVQVSKLTKELLSNGFMRGELRSDDLSPEALAALKHPDTNDPLSFYASDAILQRAKECNKQLVADLPDSVAVDRAETAAEYLTNAAANVELKAIDDSGCILISPAQPVLSRQERANRPALAALMAAATSQTGANLDAMGAFAFAEGHAPIGPLPEMKDASVPYLKCFVHDWNNFQMEGGRFLFLALYGSLDPSQRSAMFSYKPIPVRSLSQQSVDVVSDIVYGSEAVVRISSPNNPYDRTIQPPMPGMPLRPTRMIDPATRMMDRSYMREPTEAWPNGPSEDATIGLTNMARNGPNVNGTYFEVHIKPLVVKDCMLSNSAAGA